MSTIDINSVAGFKAVDANGNELGIMSLADITAAVKESLMQDAAIARSVATMSEASTLAASDTYEDQLPQKTNFTWARALDSNGNPILTSKESLASVVGGLIKSMIFDNSSYISDTDANNIVKSGFYYLTNNISNATKYSYLVVFATDDDKCCIQINSSKDCSWIRFRGYENGIWRNWVTISLA